MFGCHLQLQVLSALEAERVYREKKFSPFLLLPYTRSKEMRRLIFMAVTVLLCLGVPSTANDNYNLPELHVIKQVTLSPSYSCRPQEEFQKGYQQTALFLSDYSRRRNSPDLLFNGACRSTDYFDVSDMSLIADLGTGLSVEEITAQRAFNVRGVMPHNTKFERSVKVEAGHTYAVLLNKRDTRGLYVFTVLNYVQNQRVELRYAAKEYQVTEVKAGSTGFDWGKESYVNAAAQKN